MRKMVIIVDYNGYIVDYSGLTMANENHASLVGGWATPLKNDGVKVSWDDDIPNIMGK